MKRNNAIRIALLVLVIATLSCNLPGIATSLNPNPATGIEGTQAVAPTEGIDQAQILDLQNAALTQQDLPEGFQQLSEEEMNQLGITRERLISNFEGTLSQAEPQNYTAFIKANPPSFQIITSTVMAPITTIEKIGFDLYLSQQEQVANDFAQGASVRDVAVIPGLDTIGDKSIGITFINETESMPMRADTIIVRQDSTVQVAMIIYPEGSPPEISAGDIARLVDGKIQQALQ